MVEAVSLLADIVVGGLVMASSVLVGKALVALVDVDPK